MTDDVVMSIKMTGCHPFRSPPLRRGSAHRPLGLPQAVFAELSPLPPALAGGTELSALSGCYFCKAGLQDRPVYSGGVSDVFFFTRTFNTQASMSLDMQANTCAPAQSRGLWVATTAGL